MISSWTPCSAHLDDLLKRLLINLNCRHSLLHIPQNHVQMLVISLHSASAAREWQGGLEAGCRSRLDAMQIRRREGAEGSAEEDTRWAMPAAWSGRQAGAKIPRCTLAGMHACRQASCEECSRRGGACTASATCCRATAGGGTGCATFCQTTQAAALAVHPAATASAAACCHLGTPPTRRGLTCSLPRSSRSPLSFT